MELFDTMSSDFLDIIPVGNFMLAAYPNFLVLGPPVYNKGKVQFLPKTYLKMYCFNLNTWIKLFLRWHSKTEQKASGFINANVDQSVTIRWDTEQFEKFTITVSQGNDSFQVTISYVVVRLFLKLLPSIVFTPLCLPEEYKYCCSELYNQCLEDENLQKNIKSDLQSLIAFVNNFKSEHNLSFSTIQFCQTFDRLVDWLDLLCKVHRQFTKT